MTVRIRKKLVWFVYLLGLCAWGISTPLWAQKDSVKAPSNFGLAGSLDFRRTRLDNYLTVINGLAGGVRFGRKGHIVLVGYHWLGYDAPRLVTWRGILPRSLNLSALTTTDARFLSLSYWYPLVRTRHWFIDLPVELDYGGETTRYIGSIAPEPGTSRFQMAQAGISVSYRYVPWLGLGGRVGYRQVLFNPRFSGQFSGTYYTYGLSVYPVPAYYAFRDWREKRRKKKESR